MNQAFLLNTERVVSTNKRSESTQSIKSRTDSESKESQAFSSELEKHVEKQKESDLELGRSSIDKKHSPKESITQNGDKRQKEGVENKNGKELPKDNLSAELAVPGDVLSESLMSSGGDVLSSEESVTKLVEGESLAFETKRSDLEGLHAVSNSEANEDDAEFPVSKDLGKKISSLVKNMPKQDTENKILSDKPQQAVTNIRPDILQALSQRTESKVDENNASAGIGIKVITSTEKVIGTDKKPEGQFDLTEIVKQIKSEVAVAGKPILDKGASSFANTLVSSIHSHIANAPAAVTSERVGAPLLDIQPEVQSKAWGKVLSSRVVWMAQEGIQQAVLRLNPASLGSIEVKLSLQNEQVNISFIAQHVATRDALEQALPRLRESLGDNGLELADADVSQQESFEHANDNATESEYLSTDGEDSVVGDGGEKELPASSENDGTISVFA